MLGCSSADSTSRLWLCRVGSPPHCVWPHAARGGDDCTFFVRAGFVPSGAHGRASTRFGLHHHHRGRRAIRNAGDVVCVGPGLYVEGNIDPGHDAAAGDGDTSLPVEIRADRDRGLDRRCAGAGQDRAATGLTAGSSPPAFLIMRPPRRGHRRLRHQRLQRRRHPGARRRSTGVNSANVDPAQQHHHTTARRPASTSSRRT